METSALKIKIEVNGIFCSKGNEHCRYMKETIFHNRFCCGFFSKPLYIDELTKEHKRIDECLNRDDKFERG